MADSSKAPSEGSIRALLSDPNYVCIWAIGGLTGVIRWLQLLVLGLYTFEITGSPLLVSFVPILWMLPLALCGPLVGVLADRVNRKLLLVGSLTFIIGISIAMATFAYLDGLTFAHVAAGSLLSGLFWTTDFPVRRRLMGDLSRGALSTAMSLDSATSNATRMAGPLAGGVLLQLFNITSVFVLSAIVYASCLGLALVAKLPARTESTVTPAFVRELVGGVRFVLADRNLRRIFSITIVFNIWGFPFTSMVPIIGADHLSLSPLLVGVLSSMEGLGAFVGALAVAMLARPEHFFRVYLYGTTLYLSMIGYLGLLTYVAGGPTHSLIAASMALAVLGIASACFAAMQGTLSYLGAPPEYRSRVLGVLTLCIGTGPIGFFNVGWMAELFGVPTALFIISAEGLSVLLLLWIYGGDAEPSPARAG